MVPIHHIQPIWLPHASNFFQNSFARKRFRIKEEAIDTVNGYFEGFEGTQIWEGVEKFKKTFKQVCGPQMGLQNKK